MLTKKSILTLVVVIILTTTVSGCAISPAAKVQYITQPLPVPERPYLPAVKPAQLQCLDDQVYKNMADRDMILRHHANVLEGIIRSTHLPDKAQ